MNSTALDIRDFFKNLRLFAEDDNDLIGYVAFALFTRECQAFVNHLDCTPSSQRDSAISAFLKASTVQSQITSYKDDATGILQIFGQHLLDEVLKSKVSRWSWLSFRKVKQTQNGLQPHDLEIVLERVLSKFQETHMTHSFTTHVNAPVGNIAQGSSDFSMNATVNFQTGDWSALVQALRSAGLSDAQICDLRSAIDEDKSQGSTGIGPRVKAWLGELFMLAATGAAQIGTNAVGGAIAPLVSKFLGVG